MGVGDGRKRVGWTDCHPMIHITLSRLCTVELACVGFRVQLPMSK